MDEKTLPDTGSGEQGTLSDAWNAATNDARSEAVSAIRKKRAKSAASGSRSGSGNPESEAAMRKMAESISEMFTPENLRPILRAPADMALAVTGHRWWDLEAVRKKELDAASKMGSTAAGYFIAFDPKWIAAIMFLGTMSAAYAGPLMAELRQMRQERTASMKPSESKDGKDKA